MNLRAETFYIQLASDLCSMVPILHVPNGRAHIDIRQIALGGSVAAGDAQVVYGV